MKLAFCLFKYFPFGGLQRDFLRIARECRARGHIVHVYTMSWEGELEPGFEIHILKVNNWQNHNRIHSYIRQLQSILKTEHYDRVIGFNKMPGLDFYYAADVCYQKRAREKHNFLYRLLPRYKRLVKLEKQVFQHSIQTQILAISPFTQQEFSAYYHTETERFHLLPPGIAPDRLAPANAAELRAQLRQEYKLSDDDIMLLMVGSGFKTKGLDRTLKAFAALPIDLRSRCHLFVIGQDNAASFQQQAINLDLAKQVQFLGGRSDVANFYLAADLLLHPAYHENTGTVLLEAMCAALGVITTDICGYAHYIEKANAGSVLPSPFSQSVFNKILTDALTFAQYKQWGLNGYAFAKEADIFSMPTKAIDLIESTKSQAYSFETMMQLSGESFRSQPGRETLRVKLDEKYYFIKKHTGVGWAEILKNFLQFKKPVIGARNEYLAISKLSELGINTPKLIAYDTRGKNPARLRSYVLMQDLTATISLEDLVKKWLDTPPEPMFKRQLIKEIARIAKLMHQSGINHRDFYLCHFLLDVTAQKLYLIDLHRAQIRPKVPERWLIKDLAGLYFSSINAGFTRRDFLRFMQYYRDKSLRDIFANEQARWKKIKESGERLYYEHT